MKWIYNKYRLLPLEAIKSVYISEDFGTICFRYADPRFTPINIDKLYRCVVLIETYPEDQISVKKVEKRRTQNLAGRI